MKSNLSLNSTKRDNVSISRPSSQVDLIIGDRKSSLKRNSSNSPRKMQNYDYHIINTRIGSVAIPNNVKNPNLDSVLRPSSPKSIECEPPTENEQIELFATLSLLRTMDSELCISCIEAVPVFLRTLYLDGKLDQSIVSSISINLPTHYLQIFSSNLLREINIFSRINMCKCINDSENAILEIIPLNRVTVWIRNENSTFLYSQSLKTTIQQERSIVGYSVIQKDDLITEDPGNHPGFCIDTDLSFLRGAKSMVLLPIYSSNGDVSAVLQCVGLKSKITGAQIPFTRYYIETLKIIRNILQKKFFLSPKEYSIPSSASTSLSESDFSSLSKVVKLSMSYLETSLPCESADLFFFDDRYKKLVRVIDGFEYDKQTGGISFAAAINNDLINLPHGSSHPQFNTEIDGKFVNRSVLSYSFYSKREHYVITLRAKRNSHVFLPIDIAFIKQISPLLSEMFLISKWLEQKILDSMNSKRNVTYLQAIWKSLHDVTTGGMDPWESCRYASEVFFGTKFFFISTFDGINMRYLSTKVQCHFDECVSGKAYNYREITWVYRDKKDPLFNQQLYSELGVNAKTAVAFPFRLKGRVHGAIELINPTSDSIDDQTQILFGDLCSNLLSWLFL